MSVYCKIPCQSGQAYKWGGGRGAYKQNKSNVLEQ